VVLDESKCRGCTNCIKRCPTQAIRVRKGKARIIEERCIDCGECVRICPYHAKRADVEGLGAIEGVDYAIALPAPSLYGQYPERYPRERVASGLLALGFKAVFDVARAAEIVAAASAELLDSAAARLPLISSSCPVVVRLIQLEFPTLLPHLAPLLPPMELAARMALREPGAAQAIALGKRVGAFFISPCAAKVSEIRKPTGYSESAALGAIGFKDIYLPLLSAMNGELVPDGPVEALGRGPGIAWARAEGEAECVSGSARGDQAMKPGSFLSVDGLGDVRDFLDAMENGRARGLRFIEAMACSGGCVGGPLVAENPSIARARMRAREAEAGTDPRAAPAKPPMALSWDACPAPGRAASLHPEMARAMRMLEDLDGIREKLPGLDCGSCGAPDCRALAEDVVRGYATLNDCVFVLRERVRALAGQMLALENIQPPGLDKEGG
jgi:Fe-S-cluster-containing hydrogenase component 2